LSYYFSGQKPGGGATSHAQRAGRRPDPKFDYYTQNSSDLQCKFKNQSQNNSRAKDAKSFCEILVNMTDFYFGNFLWICPVPDLRVKNVLSNSARSAEFPVYLFIYLFGFQSSFIKIRPYSWETHSC
jgi:hypothetical protein